PSEYGYATIIAPDAGSRREPTPEERETARQRDRVRFDDVLKEVFRGDAVAFETARDAFAFPPPIRPAYSDFGKRYPAIYLRSQIAQWRERLLTVGAAVR